MPPRKTRTLGRWLPWAIAAAILVSALGGAGYVSIAGWLRKKQQLSEAETKFDKANAAEHLLTERKQREKLRAQEDMRALQDQETRLLQDWKQAAKEQDKVLSEKHVQVFIKAPRVLQAGAGNSIQIEVKRNHKGLAPAGTDLPQLNAKIVDQAGKQVLYDKVLDTKNGQTKFQLDLPLDLPVKPEMDLALEVVAKSADGAPAHFREHLDLTAPEYVTHLYTDRPMYRPGETVHYRSLTLDRFTLKPAQEELRLRFRITDPNQVEVPGSHFDGSPLLARDPKDAPLKGPDGRPLQGVGAGEFRIPDGLAGGQYTLHVSESGDRFPAVERGFVIHQGWAPRLNRPIPMVSSKMIVDFYPEGGDLINGLSNRVYFQARTSAGMPADLQGRIIDQTGTTVARIRTLTDSQEPGVNQGMGAFEFTPQGNQKYELKIESPAGMHGKDGALRYFLPTAEAGGVALHLPRGVVDETIDIEVTSADKDRHLLVGAYCRGKMLDQVNVDAPAGQRARATLHPALATGGVYRITVFDKQAGQWRPVAERLVFRKTSETLNLSVAADKQVYYPGDQVRLSLRADNEKKSPSPAVLLVSVVDRSVHMPANARTARALPTHFLLTSEVRQPEDLENADFFLGNHPLANQSLDLLLGVQGWRRFAEQDPARIQQRQNRDADVILQAAGPGGVQTNDPHEVVLAEVDRRFVPRFIELQKQLAAKEKIEAGDPATQEEIDHERMMMSWSQDAITRAVSDLDAYEHFLSRLGLGTLVVGALFLGLVMLYTGMRRLSRGRSAGGFFIVGALVLVFLFMGSLAGTFFLIAGRGFGRFDAERRAFNRVVTPKVAAMPMAPAPAGPEDKGPLGQEFTQDGLWFADEALKTGDDRIVMAKLEGAPRVPAGCSGTRADHAGSRRRHGSR